MTGEFDPQQEVQRMVLMPESVWQTVVERQEALEGQIAALQETVRMQGELLGQLTDSSDQTVQRVTKTSGHTAVEAAVAEPPKDEPKDKIDPKKLPKWLAEESGVNPPLPRHETAVRISEQLAPYTNKLHAVFADRLAASDPVDGQRRIPLGMAPKYINREPWREFVAAQDYHLPTWQEHITDGQHTITASYLALHDEALEPVNRLAQIRIDTKVVAKTEGPKPKVDRRLDGIIELEFDEDGNLGYINVAHRELDALGDAKGRFQIGRHIKIKADLRSERLRLDTTDYRLQSDNDSGTVHASSPDLFELTFLSGATSSGNRFQGSLIEGKRRRTNYSRRMELTAEDVGNRIIQVLDKVMPQSLLPNTER